MLWWDRGWMSRFGGGGSRNAVNMVQPRCDIETGHVPSRELVATHRCAQTYGRALGAAIRRVLRQDLASWATHTSSDNGGLLVRTVRVIRGNDHGRKVAPVRVVGPGAALAHHERRALKMSA